MSRPPMKSAAQLLGERLEQDPIQAVRLAVAAMVAGSFLDPEDLNRGIASAGVVTASLHVADELIARTIAAPGS